MHHIFSHRGEKIYSHHSIDSFPDTNIFNIHAHDWLEILYFISGKGNYIVEDNIYPMEPGDVFIICPGEMHKLQIDSSVPYERIVIRFAPSLLSQIDPEDKLLSIFYNRPLGQHNRYSQKDDRHNVIRAAFSNFTFENIPDIEMHLIGRLLMILTVLNGIYTHDRESVLVESMQSQLLNYVNDHLYEDISVQTIADVFSRSRSQISRVFQQSTGQTLWDYVMTKRLLAARAMIQSGESAHEACNDCGFSDYSAFYRAYKTKFGNSPREDAPK